MERVNGGRVVMRGWPAEIRFYEHDYDEMIAWGARW